MVLGQNGGSTIWFSDQLLYPSSSPFIFYLFAWLECLKCLLALFLWRLYKSWVDCRGERSGFHCVVSLGEEQISAHERTLAQGNFPSRECVKVSNSRPRKEMIAFSSCSQC